MLSNILAMWCLGFLSQCLGGVNARAGLPIPLYKGHGQAILHYLHLV